MQVYAVYYAASGRFFIGFKLGTGYFFYDSAKGRGDIVRGGERLNGGNNFALPGGRRESGETILAAARREFSEETAAEIDAVREDELRVSDDYGAGFFQIEPVQFEATVHRITATNLPAGLAASNEIVAGTIRQYAQIHQRFPAAPRDNELRDGYVWDVLDPSDWGVIESWRGNPTIGWYYVILKYLRTTILRA